MKKEPLRKDITGLRGTYTKEIFDNIEKLNILAEDNSVDLNTYRAEVLKTIANAHNTPAKATFISRLNRITKKEDAVFYVYNAYLAGAGLAMTTVN